jgi:hypothetical protein
MTDLNHPVLVTGASTGIGNHLVKYLAARGHIVYGTARKDDDLAALLHRSERYVRRLGKAVREYGDRGIVHRGRPSSRRFPEGVKKRVLRLYRTQYPDCGPTPAAEKLLEREGLEVSRETLRQWLLSAGLREKRRKKRRHRQWRARQACFGAMVPGGRVSSCLA